MANGFKTGGREQGTPNRVTKELRAILKDVLYEEICNLPDLLKELPPKERVELMVRLTSFVLPKVHSVHMKEDEPWEF